MSTPKEQLDKYIELKENINRMSQKQKKKASRELTNIEQTYKSLERDVDTMNRVAETQKELDNHA